MNFSIFTSVLYTHCLMNLILQYDYYGDAHENTENIPNICAIISKLQFPQPPLLRQTKRMLYGVCMYGSACQTHINFCNYYMHSNITHQWYIYTPFARQT